MKKGLLTLLLCVQAVGALAFYSATYEEGDRTQISPWMWLDNTANKFNMTNGWMYTTATSNFQIVNYSTAVDLVAGGTGSVTTAYIAADTAVSNGLVVAYTAADTVVSNALRTDIDSNYSSYTNWLATNTYVKVETDPIWLAWLGTNTYVKTETDPVFTNWLSTNATYEPALGNPASDGYVLSSTTGGTRSWVEQSGGGGTSGVAPNACAVYRSEAGQSATNTSAVAILWDTEDTEDADFTHASSNSTIYVGSTARYLISGIINYWGTTSNYRLTCRVTVRINGTNTLSNKFDACYIRVATGSNRSGTPFSLVLDLTAGDYIEILTSRLSSTSGNGVVGSGTTISLVKLESGGGPTKYGFEASKGSDQAISASTDTLVTFSVEESDVGGGFDLATDRFTPPYAGRYLVYVACATALSDNKRTYAKIFTNGVSHKEGMDSARGGSEYITPKVSSIISLTTNDYVEAYCFSTLASTIYGDSGSYPRQTTFFATYIGE